MGYQLIKLAIVWLYFSSVQLHYLGRHTTMLSTSDLTIGTAFLFKSFKISYTSPKDVEGKTRVCARSCTTHRYDGLNSLYVVYRGTASVKSRQADLTWCLASRK